MRYLSAVRTYQSLCDETNPSSKIVALRSRALQEVIRAEHRVWSRTVTLGSIWLVLASGIGFEALGAVTYSNLFFRVIVSALFTAGTLFCFQTLEGIRSQLRTGLLFAPFGVCACAMVIALLLEIVNCFGGLAVNNYALAAAAGAISLGSCWLVFAFCKRSF